MNVLNKSEASRGKPSKNDTQNPHDLGESMHDYETTVGRGVYSTNDWSKTKSYAVPYAPQNAKLTAIIVLLLR
eukprot:9051478-Lingulodinium_polyedra.AAC.1